MSNLISFKLETVLRFTHFHSSIKHPNGTITAYNMLSLHVIGSDKRCVVILWILSAKWFGCRSFSAFEVDAYGAISESLHHDSRSHTIRRVKFGTRISIFMPYTNIVSYAPIAQLNSLPILAHSRPRSSFHPYIYAPLMPSTHTQSKYLIWCNRCKFILG